MGDTGFMPDQNDVSVLRGLGAGGGDSWVNREDPARLYWCLAGFVAVWFGFGAVAGLGKALHNDMTEAYVWGREFQLGYNQHPPFWAWIAGVWFMVFPRTNWPFVLLSVLNAAVGLLGAWRLIGLFAGGWTRWAAMMLLLCTPFYTFKADNYNANSIFLSLWPWTCVFFVRSMDTRRHGLAALFGVMMGLCLLSKYYAIVLIITCVGASFAHSEWRRYYRSASPWVAVGVAAVMFLPHVLWVLRSHATPVEYALGLSGLGVSESVENIVAFLIEITAFHVVVLAIVLLSRRWGGGGARSERRDGGRGRWFLAALVFLPPVVTLLLGFGLELKVAGRMTIGVFPLLPLWLMQVVPGVDARRGLRLATVVAVGTAAGALIASPAITAYTFVHSTNESYALPQQELAQEATRMWQRQTHAPLRYVGGSKFIGNAVAFYSEEQPSGFVLMSFLQAPWVTSAALRRDGLLAVCLVGDESCLGPARSLSGPDTVWRDVSLGRRLWSWVRAPVEVEVFIYPPHAD